MIEKYDDGFRAPYEVVNIRNLKRLFRAAKTINNVGSEYGLKSVDTVPLHEALIENQITVIKELGFTVDKHNVYDIMKTLRKIL